MNRKPLLALLCALLVTVAGAVWATGAAADWAPPNYQNVATAIPGASGDRVSDLASKVRRVSGDMVTGSAVATTSVTCDSCSGDAVTMQVLYARNVETVHVNNVAAAWSACTGCQGSALSLQVIIARSAKQLLVNNRSLALNTACLDCHTVAAAVQIVLISPHRNRLSAEVVDSLVALREQLHQQLLAELAAPPTAPAAAARMAAPRAAAPPAVRPGIAAPSTAASPVDATVLAIQQQLAADLQASASSHDIQLTHG